MTRKVKIMIAVPLAMVAVVALFAVVGLVSLGGTSADSTGGAPGAATTSAERAALAGAPEPVMGSDAGTASKSMSGGAADGQDFAAAVPPASAPSAHYLLRTGDLSLLVKRGTLLPTVDRIRSMTTAMSGYVMSSAVGSQAGGPVQPMPLDAPVASDGSIEKSATSPNDPYASLVVRVPEQLFETAIKRFSKLGDVQSVSTSSEDVTSQYVDLQARLRHYRAVERRLVGFLQETTTVNQMLAVQDRIDQVQLTIEELTAQLKSLRETTTYGDAVGLRLREGHDAGGDPRQQHLRRHVLELHRAARPRRPRHGAGADRAAPVHRRLRRHRRGRLDGRAAAAAGPAAGGAAVPAGLTSAAARGRRPLRRAGPDDRPRPGLTASPVSPGRTPGMVLPDRR